MEKKLNVKDIPLTDPYVYKFLGTGNTIGIFQVESPGMQGLMKQMFADVAGNLQKLERKYECTGYNPIYHGSATDTAKIESIEEDFKKELDVLGKELFERVIAAISLYRPGPMDYIPDYIKGMNDPASIEYDTPELEEILAQTYGVIVYQEQVQQIVRKLAGYSLGRGDLIRRAMGKKKTAIMDAEEKVFLYGNEKDRKEGEALVTGCIANGITEDAAKTVWEKMKKFALYAFNKSHSAGYAVITVQTAWLKYYYKVDFICATLNSVITDAKKLKHYIADAKDNEIKILAPDVNDSILTFEIDNDTLEIRTGLVGIKGLGNLATPIVEERLVNGEFEDIKDLVDRLINNVDKKVLTSLIYSGALDKFGKTRKSLMVAIDDILTFIKEVKAGLFPEIPFSLPEVDKAYIDGRSFEVEDLEEFDKKELLEKEYEYNGMYISGHPLDDYKDILKLNQSVNIYDILPEEVDDQELATESVYNDAYVLVGGVIRNKKQIITKKGDKMFMLDIEDETASIKCVVFPKVAASFEHLIEDNNVIAVEGRVNDNERGCQIVVGNIKEMSELGFENTKILYINAKNADTKDINDFVTANPGTTTVKVKTEFGWLLCKTKLKLDWANYLKLKDKYQVILK